MVKALFYKEWIKTKRIILLLAIIFAGGLVYTFINTAQMFRIGGAVQTWDNIILKDLDILPVIMQWAPLLAGLLVGFSQFIPEITNKRLKLTLHLPLPESKTISAMLLYGILVLMVFFIVSFIVLLTGFCTYYPMEIVNAMLFRTTPWFLAGLVSYIFIAWVCLEPVWKYRICYSFIAICIVSLFYINAKSGAYLPFIPYLIGFIIIAFSFPFFSTARFKDGAQ